MFYNGMSLTCIYAAAAVPVVSLAVLPRVGAEAQESTNIQNLRPSVTLSHELPVLLRFRRTARSLLRDCLESKHPA